MRNVRGRFQGISKLELCPEITLDCYDESEMSTRLNDGRVVAGSW
jgi:hypothetical protein